MQKTTAFLSPKVVLNKYIKEEKYYEETDMYVRGVDILRRVCSVGL